MFDEAAGIVKYKKRRQEARKKLENEQQNLIRIGDIVSELERRVGPLERQAEKAKVYLKKRDEMRSYDINLFLSEYQDAKGKLEDLKTNAQNASASLQEIQEQARQIRLEYDRLQEEASRLEGEHARLSEAMTDEKLRISHLEGQAQLLSEQIRQGKEANERQKQRLEELTRELLEKRQDEDAVSSAAKALKEQAEEISCESTQKEQDLFELQQELQAKEEEAASIQERLYTILEERTAIRAEMSRCDAMAAQQRVRLAQIDRQVLKYQSDETRQKEQIAALEQEAAKIEKQIEELNDQSTRINTSLEQCQQKLTGVSASLEEENTKYHREASRLDALKGIAERYDGYGNSIRRVMEQRRSNSGILGVVADLLRTRKDYEIAIETALGGSIQNIVTEDEQTAREMISYLKENRYGRATFLPLTAMKQADFRQREVLEEDGVIELASSLVESERKYQNLVSQLLGRSVVVDHIDHAIALARKYHYSLRIVTLGGELLTPGGAMTGGAFKNTSNLLSRRREIDDLSKAVARRQQKIQELKDSIDSLRDERTGLRTELVKISEQIQKKYLEQNTASLRRQEMKNRSKDTARETLVIEEEKEKLLQAAKELDAQKAEEARKLRLSEKEEVSLRWSGEQLSEDVEQLSGRETQLVADLEQIHLQLQAATQKRDFLKTDAMRLQGEILAMEEEEKQLKSSQNLAGADIAEKEKQIASAREEASALKAQLTLDEQAASSIQKQKETSQENLKKTFDRREEISEQSGLLEKETVRLEAQIERLNEKQEGRSNYMWEEYELTYAQAISLKRDDLGSRSEWRRKMNLLKGELRDLGPVNVNAIEEYKEVSERYEFLTKQQKDIIEAEKALEKIIRDLNEGMRQQFITQFARIREEFDKSFRELFGGGTGTLELVDENDVLETGIRIIAQPPGKKLQNMMQMSGGEKSLTAIALLFGIQNMKPSPFCLLDEIEAALDEHNVERYARYLHKLTKNTQFIIITHRRGTMAAADRLYGITMQEKGISTLVSVDLIEGDLDK